MLRVTAGRRYVAKLETLFTSARLSLGVLVAAVVGFTVIGLTAAQADDAIAGDFTLRALHSGKCVDVEGASPDNGARILQWDCHGRSNQQWELRPIGNGYQQVVSAVSGRCLNVSGADTQNGAPIIAWECVGAANEQWRLEPSPDGRGYRLRARHSNRCLDVARASQANGGRLIQFDCGDVPQQQFLLTRSAPSNDELAPAAPAAATPPVSRRRAQPTTAWPTATRTVQLRGTERISGDFDAENTRYQLSGGGQGENQDPLFILEDGAVLRNAIIGDRAADGIHCAGSCTLINVWWEDVGEDAATMLSSAQASDLMTIDGGGARSAADKVFQHNGAGTMVVRNFQADNIGKLVRTCGNCSRWYQRDVVIDNVVVSRLRSALVGINLNFGDTATITRAVVIGSREPVCEHYRGVARGRGEPERIGEGPNSQCRYSAADITYR